MKYNSNGTTTIDPGEEAWVYRGDYLAVNKVRMNVGDEPDDLQPGVYLIMAEPPYFKFLRRHEKGV